MFCYHRNLYQEKYKHPNDRKTIDTYRRPHVICVGKVGDECIPVCSGEYAIPKNNTQCGNTTNEGANNSNVPEIIPNTKCLELLISKVPENNVNVYHDDCGIQANKHDWKVIAKG